MPTNYLVSVMDAQQRRLQIAEKEQTGTRTFFEYSGNATPLSIKRLDIGVPIYRLGNYRTQTRQKAYLRRHNLPNSFFENGEENETAQRVQHDILYEFAETGQGESVLAIVEALKQDRRQTEPLLLTAEGVVVNGNRRLAAMRELFAEDPANYASFEAVDAMILPAGINPDEIRRIEVRLQMAPQTLLPYEWMDAALAVRDLRNRAFSDREIATLMRLPRPSEVSTVIDQLNEAEYYLEEYLQRPGEYELVENHEQMFKELDKNLRDKDGLDKELSRKIAYILINNSAALGRRAYEFRAAFGDDSSEVMERLAERLDLPFVEDEPENGTGGDDVFGGLDADPNSRFRPLEAVLSDPARGAELAVTIREIEEHLQERRRNRDRGQAALDGARRAHTFLAEIDLTQADPQTYEALRRQLISIIDRATELLRGLDDR